MGTTAIDKTEHLFWLGRYVERVYTTLKHFFIYFDNMIETGDDKDNSIIYNEFCISLSIPNIYTSTEDFVQRYLFDEKNPDSIYSNLLHAYDNAVVLRDTLSSESLAYIQMALDTLQDAEDTESFLMDLQPVIDYILAFWGSIEDFVDDEFKRNLMKYGKHTERIDLYIRLGYERDKISRVIDRLANRIQKLGIAYNAEKLGRLMDIVNRGDIKNNYFDALDSVERIYVNIA